MSVNFTDAIVIPNLVPVESSLIRKLTYIDGDLYLLFTTGRLYVYKDVPMALFIQFLRSSSLGSFFNMNIRDSYNYDYLR